jgi:sugar diacid utilization regulator
MCVDYAELQKEFAHNWAEIRTQKRIEIHINSLGWDRFQKMTTLNFHS